MSMSPERAARVVNKLQCDLLRYQIIAGNCRTGDAAAYFCRRITEISDKIEQIRRELEAA